MAKRGKRNVVISKLHKDQDLESGGDLAVKSFKRYYYTQTAIYWLILIVYLPTIMNVAYLYE